MPPAGASGPDRLRSDRALDVVSPSPRLVPRGGRRSGGDRGRRAARSSPRSSSYASRCSASVRASRSHSSIARPRWPTWNRCASHTNRGHWPISCSRARRRPPSADAVAGGASLVRTRRRMEIDGRHAPPRTDSRRFPTRTPAASRSRTCGDRRRPRAPRRPSPPPRLQRRRTALVRRPAVPTPVFRTTAGGSARPGCRRGP